MIGIGWLLVCAILGMVLVMFSRPGGILETVGATLAIASIFAIPVGYALGTFTP